MEYFDRTSETGAKTLKALEKFALGLELEPEKVDVSNVRNVIDCAALIVAYYDRRYYSDDGIRELETRFEKYVRDIRSIGKSIGGSNDGLEYESSSLKIGDYNLATMPFLTRILRATPIYLTAEYVSLRATEILSGFARGKGVFSHWITGTLQEVSRDVMEGSLTPVGADMAKSACFYGALSLLSIPVTAFLIRKYGRRAKAIQRMNNLRMEYGEVLTNRLREEIDSGKLVHDA